MLIIRIVGSSKLNTGAKDKGQWQLVHRLTDRLINDNDFNEMFYSRDGKSLRVNLSEQSATVSCINIAMDSRARLLQVNLRLISLTQTRDGRWIYYRANKSIRKT